MKINYGEWKVEYLNGSDDIVVCKHSISVKEGKKVKQNTSYTKYLHNKYWSGVRVFETWKLAEKVIEELNSETGLADDYE